MQVQLMFAAPWAISPVLSVNNIFHTGPEFHSYGPPSYSFIITIYTTRRGLQSSGGLLKMIKNPGIFSQL